MRNALVFALTAPALLLAAAVPPDHPPQGHSIPPADYTHGRPADYIHGKPVYELEILPVVQGSLERMWANADAVFDVQLLSSHARANDDDGFHVHTFHTASVLHAFKGAAPKDSPLVFSQTAGQVELPDRIVRIAGLAPLAVGQRYIVFLLRNEMFGPWSLAGERDGAFMIRNGRIEPQGFGRVADEQRNVTESQFVRQLDRLARRPKQRP